MPELPEVETTRRGIAPWLRGKRLRGAVVREPRLRLPVPSHLSETLARQRVCEVERRAKYLLLRCDRGSLLLHLGMSGSLRVVAEGTPAAKHDHLDLLLPAGRCLRFHDPRRFGMVVWTEDDPSVHPLLAHLGPEPLSGEFSGEYLHARSRGRKLAVKSFLMDGRIVVGVGNIYACEALFRAGLRPGRAAGRISRPAYGRLAEAVRATLNDALRQGGTTLRDFHKPNGEPGYFELELSVYGRAGEPCRACETTVRVRRLGQRSTFYCPRCQS